MPTLPVPPPKLFDNPSAHGPYERLTRTVGQIYNTVPFNSGFLLAPLEKFDTSLTPILASGHPALAIPVGFVPAEHDKTIKLPTSLQTVGRKFDDITCLKVGAAFEKAYNWRESSLVQ